MLHIHDADRNVPLL